MPPTPWPDVPLELDHFRHPPREYGILPFWFLNGELDPSEMQFQLREFRDKGMPGVILHGRYGLEMPYLGPQYLARIQFAVAEAARLGLQTWIYDEMNWPSGTADGRVLRQRPDLAQRYLECISFTIQGPWFTYLTGADSRYLDFERSTPVAAFALGSGGQIIDLTPNLSFTNVIPWEAPPGQWRLMYVVEKRADYYIDALNPEATAEFLRIGYEPYVEAIGNHLPDGASSSTTLGFYTDEPAMHYFLSGGDNAIVPWTKDMFRRFQERNGYNLRPRLPDLFFDVRPDSARVRYDFYSTLTEFYSAAYYCQIHAWCQQHDVLFTGHMLYEESLRQVVRVEGNLFKHYAHMDIPGVDHLYPLIGNRDRPGEHVAIKVASSAAHQLGRQRLLCESFGGIFMDTTPQRMKWIADWEYVLGVNLLNPHGFHYTLEGPRKRDWPPSMFYQYPWWPYYGDFSAYVSRLSCMLTGGHHVAKVAVLWPINATFGTYTPNNRSALADRMEGDFDVLTDLLLRLHYDFDYLDEDGLASAELNGNTIRIQDEVYELVILPPMTHLRLETVARLEQFVAQGGRLLGMIFLPERAFGPAGLVDVSGRLQALFGVNPQESQRNFRHCTGVDVIVREHPGGGKTAFFQSYALARRFPLRLQQQLGTPGYPDSPFFVVEPAPSAAEGPVPSIAEGPAPSRAKGSAQGTNHYFFAPPDADRQEITAEVVAERQAVADALQTALAHLVAPDVVIDNPEIFYLHRVKDGRDLYFLVNPTFTAQSAQVTLRGCVQPMVWDPSTGAQRPIVPWREVDGQTCFRLTLPPVGSAFVVPAAPSPAHPRTGIAEADVVVESIAGGQVSGYAARSEGAIVLERDGQQTHLVAHVGEPADPLVLDGEWEFEPQAGNALVIGHWLARAEVPGTAQDEYAAPAVATDGWLPMVPGAWSYQLPAEPDQSYPIPVWYRATFQAGYRPSKLDLIVDGFAGSAWQLFVNGQPVTEPPVRSGFDSQMKAVDVTDLVREGENVIAVRLTVTGATGGLLDLLKLVGDFSLARRPGTGLRAGEGGEYALVAPRRTVQPASWTIQGYPFFSGRAVYRRRFHLPDQFANQRVFLEPEMGDDVLEVHVNGRLAGVRLWAPYAVEVTECLQPGENVLELQVANTLVNLLEAVERPAGLAGAPRLVPYRRFTFDLPG